ncbi:MAG: hypothetical protein A6F71_10450 [Cycloclasticus sp. symbiont of Poecilosclerida sp. M]|nr:MAG: hypothetical protein A6F71_10450 [Cycloclasticus sp. symbiont of Poecilosclerida sp. M]
MRAVRPCRLCTFESATVEMMLCNDSVDTQLTEGPPVKKKPRMSLSPSKRGQQHIRYVAMSPITPNKKVIVNDSEMVQPNLLSEFDELILPVINHN